MAFVIRSPAFEEGGNIPVVHTCDGDDRSPPLLWSGEPPGTRAFALIVHDPDAPAGDWVHWVLYDLPGSCHELPEGIPSRAKVTGLGRQGKNDFRRLGWGGPCPPRGPAHHYRFRLLALDEAPETPPDASRERLLEALHGHVLGEAVLTGRYQRR
jgi:Raf kinase inhibitor-like YbhB/YbcL family protein